MARARAAGRCTWCVETETMIARQVFRIHDLMDANEALTARNTELMAANRKLRLALGHPRPLLAALRADEESG